MKVKIMINKHINFIKLFLNNLPSQSKSFSLPVIFSFLDIKISDNASTLTQYSYSVFILSIVGLFCFINILGFLVTYILIQQGDYEKKYPKFKIIINYYKKITLVYAIIETLLCLICFLLLIIFAIIAIRSGNI
jgi:hypothetical protein